MRKEKKPWWSSKDTEDRSIILIVISLAIITIGVVSIVAISRTKSLSQNIIPTKTNIIEVYDKSSSIRDSDDVIIDKICTPEGYLLILKDRIVYTNDYYLVRNLEEKSKK